MVPPGSAAAPPDLTTGMFEVLTHQGSVGYNTCDNTSHQEWLRERLDEARQPAYGAPRRCEVSVVLIPAAEVFR